MSVRSEFAAAAGTGVVVIGGSNMDVKTRTAAPPVLGTSNPGVSSTTAGGVGRNVAENLARLDVPTELVSAIGTDAAGSWLRSITEAAGVGMGHSVTSPGATGLYNAILDDAGDLLVAAASMEALDGLTAATVDAAAATIAASAYVVLDCNVNAVVLVRAAQVASSARVPLVVDPVSVAKSARVLAILDAGLAIHTLTPNVDELRALTGDDASTTDELLSAAAVLHDRGVINVWIRRGENGSLLSTREAGETRHETLSACRAQLADATGAGDAMLAGYVAALVRGLAPRDSVRYGRAAAAMTVESTMTVSELMSYASLARRVRACDESR